MKKLFYSFLDDMLLLAGCICILIGLSLWSVVITWLAAGLILIGFGVLVGKAKAKNVTR